MMHLAGLGHAKIHRCSLKQLSLESSEEKESIYFQKTTSDEINTLPSF